jgi:hypothetical protein
MYTIPMHRIVAARYATTDRKVVVAGPTGASPEPSAACHRKAETVGHMKSMIGAGCAHVRGIDPMRVHRLRQLAFRRSTVNTD